jgi:hypothetical protein
VIEEDEEEPSGGLKAAQVRKTPFFGFAVVYSNCSVYQDRLGTSMGKALKKERRFTQASLDLFEPELEDAPEPEEGEEKGEPVLVNAEEKAELEGKLAAEQAKVDAATADVAEAEAALAAAEGVVEECKAKVASERAALLAAAEALQVRGRKNI